MFHFSLAGTITSWVVIFILPINSALNPILYTLTTRPFKEMIHQFWYNYRQRRSIDSKGSQKAYAPSFIWVEMWPLQEMTADLMKPALFKDPCELSLISQSTRLNSYSWLTLKPISTQRILWDASWWIYLYTINAANNL